MPGRAYHPGQAEQRVVPARALGFAPDNAGFRQQAEKNPLR